MKPILWINLNRWNSTPRCCEDLQRRWLYSKFICQTQSKITPCRVIWKCFVLYKRVPYWGIWQTDFQKVILPRGSNVTFISPFIPRSQHRPQKCSDLHHWEHDPWLAYNPFTLPIVSNGAMSIVKIIKPMLIQWFTSIFPPLASNNKIMWEVSQSISVHVQFICSRLHSPDTGYLQVSESQI